MFDGVKLWSVRRKLRSSLSSDPLQVGWTAWLDSATSSPQLRETCSHPGWLVHCGYWADVPQNTLLETAIVMAQLAIDHGPPNVFPRESAMDLRQRTFPEVADTIVDIERRYPAMRAIETTLPGMGVTGMSLAHLAAARKASGTEDKPAALDALPQAGVAGAAAAGFSLALQTLFHRHYGLREPLMLSVAGAASLFHLALPDHKTELLSLVRDRFGW